jgi:hypothetical protein
LLLRLERFEQAEAAVAQLRASSAPLAREFLAAYPPLAFRQRLSAGCRLLRAGAAADALRIFEATQAVDSEGRLELAYCRAFGLTMEAYRLRRAAREDDARATLAQALDGVEGHVAAARASGHTRLIELYETLDKELDH